MTSTTTSHVSISAVVSASGLINLAFFFILLHSFIIHTSCVEISLETFQRTLLAAQTTITTTLNQLNKRWDIPNYPNFLTSASMPLTSWEMHKIKFEHKILLAMTSEQPVDYVISFMGSSVTAGHDSAQNQSVVAHTQKLMEASLAKLNITLIARNVAQGNNPCFPYDVCIKTFAGLDADVVHWEQSYNCFDKNSNWIYEQFIRQAAFLPNLPVIAFADSSTPNWRPENCKGKSSKHQITSDEKELFKALSSNPLKIATELSGKKINGRFVHMSNLLKAYKTVGIQFWSHQEYSVYQCQGPYVKDWGCCSASWHPSLLGHELRGSHHSYFWLLILQDAIKSLLANNNSLAEQLASVKTHIESSRHHIPIAPIYPMNPQVVDGIQCLSDYEPRPERESDLASRVVGAPLGTNDNQWKRELFEFLQPDGRNFIKIHKEKLGVLDYKWLLYGNKESGSLSLSIHVQKAGTAFLCAPPGEWGKLPTGFSTFWTVNTKIFLTENVPRPSPPESFVFDLSKAKALSYTNRRPQDTQTICVDFSMRFSAGDHILTIVPTTDAKIMIGLVILP